MRRRLALISCPEPVSDMDRVDGGLHCHRCSLKVHDTTGHSQAEFEGLLDGVARGRVCAQVRAERGRVRLAGGALAAGVSLVVLSGCTPHDDDWERLLEGPLHPGSCEDEAEDEDGDECTDEWHPPAVEVDTEEDGGCTIIPHENTGPLEGPATVDGGQIGGLVTGSNGAAIPGALLVLSSHELEETLELYTDERGMYRFNALPPGEYTIQALAGRGNQTKTLELQAKRKVRANFRIDQSEQMLRGVVVEVVVRPIDTTSASSTLVVE